MANTNGQSNRVQDNSGFMKAPEITLFNDDQWRIVREKYHMTPREIEIAKLICRGLSNEDIADSVKIKYGTVKTHIRNIYRRIHVKSKVGMLLRFMEDTQSHGVGAKK
jgi:DNA-binding CsgD family transcriptional regulator